MSEPHQAEPGHETRDVNYNAVFGLAGLAIVLGLAIGLGIWWLFADLRERQSRRLPAALPLGFEQQGQLPPPPQLEGIERMTMPWGSPAPAEAKLPGKYEWVDRKAGVVRVPMDRAMAIIVERKLIGSAAEPAPPSLRDPYAALPSRANSGRTPQKEQP